MSQLLWMSKTPRRVRILMNPATWNLTNSSTSTRSIGRYSSSMRTTAMLRPSTANSGCPIESKRAGAHQTTATMQFGIATMLPTALVKEINRLLKEGELSHRKIALRLGVGRGTISAIATGRRALHGKEQRRRGSDELPKSPPFRCPRCGYRVYIPCRICRMRRYRDGQLLLHLLARSDQELERRLPQSDSPARKTKGKRRSRRYFRAS